MAIIVQVIQITETRTVKTVLAKMRAATPAQYEYIQTIDGRLIRFSSETKGEILPLIALDKVNALDPESPDVENLTLLVNQSADLCFHVTVQGGVIRSIDSILKDSLSQLTFGKYPIAAESTLLEFLTGKQVREFAAITQQERDVSPHRFGEEKAKIPLKWVGIGGVLAIAIAALTFSWVGQEDDTVEKAEQVVKVKEVRKVRFDPYHKYKKTLENRAEYHEIADSLITATLMAAKLPPGWKVEDIVFSNNTVTAPILNTDGRTQALKYFRTSDPNGIFVDVDGQSARFLNPISPSSWWRWTQHIDSFVAVRDDLMDSMVLLGGRVRSEEPVYDIEEKFTKQLWEFSFESVTVAYLDLFKTIFDNKPILIDVVSVRPASQRDSTLVNIQIIATVIGR